MMTVRPLLLAASNALRRMARVRKTQGQIDEEDRRTNEVALFNSADAYVLCAKVLAESPPDGLRFPSPIGFLLYHGIEFCLKQFLRHAGVSIDTLTNKYGH